MNRTAARPNRTTPALVGALAMLALVMLFAMLFSAARGDTAPPARLDLVRPQSAAEILPSPEPQAAPDPQVAEQAQPKRAATGTSSVSSADLDAKRDQMIADAEGKATRRQAPAVTPDDAPTTMTPADEKIAASEAKAATLEPAPAAEPVPAPESGEPAVRPNPGDRTPGGDVSPGYGPVQAPEAGD